MLTIQDFAQLCHCSTQTLRYYDKINLLKPFYRQEITGYRFYLETQSEDFFKIKELQDVGWTIKEIKHVLEKDDDYILEKLEEKKEILREKLERTIILLETYREKKMKTEEKTNMFIQKHKTIATQQQNIVYLRKGDEEVEMDFNCNPAEFVNFFNQTQKTSIITFEDLNDFENTKDKKWIFTEIYYGFEKIDDITIKPVQLIEDENRLLVHMFYVKKDFSLFDVMGFIENMENLGYIGQGIFCLSLSENHQNSYTLVYTE